MRTTRSNTSLQKTMSIRNHVVGKCFTQPNIDEDQEWRT